MMSSELSPAGIFKLLMPSNPPREARAACVGRRLQSARDPSEAGDVATVRRASGGGDARRLIVDARSQVPDFGLQYARALSKAVIAVRDAIHTHPFPPHSVMA